MIRNIKKLENMIKKLENLQADFYELKINDYHVNSTSCKIIDKLNICRVYMHETIIKIKEIKGVE